MILASNHPVCDVPRPRLVGRVSRRAPASRSLALIFPWLSTDRLRGTRPHLFTRADDAPVALVQPSGRAIVLHGVDRAGAQAGLSAGITLLEAQARVPALATYPHDPAADHDWLEALAAACGRWSPAVAIAAPDALVLEIAGDGEAALAAEIEGRFARRGVLLRHAFGAMPAVALALARFAGAPAPDEQGAVRRLPVAALDLDPIVAVELAAAGLKTVGDVMTLSAASLALVDRSVSVALRRLSTASAPKHSATPKTNAPDAEWASTTPIWRTEQLLAAMAELTEEAVARLGPQEGARAWEATLFGADGRVCRFRIDQDRPTCDATFMLARLRDRLARRVEPVDPGAGYDLIRLSIMRTEPLDAQDLALEGGTNRPVQPAQRRPAVRRRHVASPGREDAQLALPTGAAPAVSRPVTDAEPLAAPIHLFDPPEPIAKEATEAPDGPPRRFRWRRRLHEVVRVEGPEQAMPDCWCGVEAAATRDYYRVEDQRGRRLWIFRLLAADATAPRWYVHGLFA